MVRHRRMRIHQLLFILLTAASALQAKGDWRTSRLTKARQIRPACSRQGEGNDSNERAELHLAIFDARKTSVRVIDQPNEPRSDLASVMARENCLAGVNGGYFDPEYNRRLLTAAVERSRHSVVQNFFPEF